jgi:hypothetical protein
MPGKRSRSLVASGSWSVVRRLASWWRATYGTGSLLERVGASRRRAPGERAATGTLGRSTQHDARIPGRAETGGGSLAARATNYLSVLCGVKRLGLDPLPFLRLPGVLPRQPGCFSTILDGLQVLRYG